MLCTAAGKGSMDATALGCLWLVTEVPPVEPCCAGVSRAWHAQGLEKARLRHSLLSSQGWSSFTTGASKFASAAKEGVSNWVHAVHHWPRVLGSFHILVFTLLADKHGALSTAGWPRIPYCSRRRLFLCQGQTACRGGLDFVWVETEKALSE